MATTHNRDEGAGIRSPAGLPSFQLLLDQFKGNLTFVGLVDREVISPDEFLYEIETSDGIYFVFEVDFIDSFDAVASLIKDRIGGITCFVEVKQPPEKFEETSPYKASSIYLEPKDFSQFKKYVNDKHGSYNCYFNFLIKK